MRTACIVSQIKQGKYTKSHVEYVTIKIHIWFKNNIYISKLNGFGHHHCEGDSIFLAEVFSSSHHHAPTFFSLVAEKGSFSDKGIAV